MRRFVVVASLATALMSVAAFSACKRDNTGPDAAALANEPFFISGEITEAGRPWGYRIKGVPGTSYRIDEAYFRLDSNTILRRADGSTATAADLVVGSKISLWITGPIMESHPVQVFAQRIVFK